VRALALHVLHNTGGKNDAGGAFIPEAVHFQRLHACHREGLDNRLAPPQRRAAAESILVKHRDLECVAIFCHGLRRSLQTGHDMRTVGDLAAAIATASGPRVVVALYACSTGATDDGFAAKLASSLAALGKVGHVDAHTNAAHTTKNPNVKRFPFGDPVSRWLVVPGTPMWQPWRIALKGDLRWRFPLMTQDAVFAELAVP
jgi:hypothetical protein